MNRRLRWRPPKQRLAQRSGSSMRPIVCRPGRRPHAVEPSPPCPSRTRGCRRCRSGSRRGAPAPALTKTRPFASAVPPADHVEHPDRRAAPRATHDVEPALVGREAQAVRAADVAGRHGRLRRLPGRADRRWSAARAAPVALVVAEDAEGRIGEPDRAVGLDDHVVGRVERACRRSGRISTVIGAVVLGAGHPPAACSQVTSRPWRSRVLPLE